MLGATLGRRGTHPSPSSRLQGADCRPYVASSKRPTSATWAMEGRAAGSQCSISRTRDAIGAGASSKLSGSSTARAARSAVGGSSTRMAVSSTPSAHTSAACSSAAVACVRPLSSGASSAVTSRSACRSPSMPPLRICRHAGGSKPSTLTSPSAPSIRCSARSWPWSKPAAWLSATVVASCRNHPSLRVGGAGGQGTTR